MLTELIEVYGEGQPLTPQQWAEITETWSIKDIDIALLRILSQVSQIAFQLHLQEHIASFGIGGNDAPYAIAYESYWTEVTHGLLEAFSDYEDHYTGLLEETATKLEWIKLGVFETNHIAPTLHHPMPLFCLEFVSILLSRFGEGFKTMVEVVC